LEWGVQHHSNEQGLYLRSQVNAAWLLACELLRVVLAPSDGIDGDELLPQAVDVIKVAGIG